MPSARRAQHALERARGRSAMRCVVVVGADAVLGDEQRQRRPGDLPRPAERRPRAPGARTRSPSSSTGTPSSAPSMPSGPMRVRRVGLHAEEVVALGGVEEHVLHAAPACGAVALLAAVDGLVVGHRQREPDRHARRRGPDGVDRLAVGVDEHVVDPPAQARRRGSPGGKHAERGSPIVATMLGSLIVQARPHHVAELARQPLAEARRSGRRCRAPPTRRGRPPSAAS